MQELHLEFHNLTAMTRTACLEREINLNFKQASFLTGKESVRSHQLFNCTNVSSHEVYLTDTAWREEIVRVEAAWQLENVE